MSLKPQIVMDSKILGTWSLSVGLYLPKSYEPGVGPFPLVLHLSQEYHIESVNTRALMEDILKKSR